MTITNQQLIQSEIQEFINSGKTDPMYGTWPGDLFARAREANHELRAALINEVKSRSEGKSSRQIPILESTHSFTYKKVEPMVRGLFPADEQEIVLDALSKSVIFVTHDNIYDIIEKCVWHSTAWTLANMYLSSVNAELLGPSAPSIVGLSEELICYLSPAYFSIDDPYSDYIVHEAAHVFHNNKRASLGLSEKKTEWLLPIHFGLRETFAYACEAYSRISEKKSKKERMKLFENLENPPDESVDHEIYRQAILAAISARNGWRKILKACSHS